MELEEAIKHCEERANLLEESAAGCDMTDKVEKEIVCRSGKCAAEHRQLAEWLKELKERREKDGQLEPTTEIQEILNYLDTTLHPIVSPDNWNVYAELHDMVSTLSFAQPEIVRCKDCKYGEQDDIGRWFCSDLGCQMGNEDGSGYCADAVRRTND